MSKPCDSYDRLPCRDDGYRWCLGPVAWEHRSFKTGERERLELSQMDTCPWAKRVHAWLENAGRLKRGGDVMRMR